MTEKQTFVFWNLFWMIFVVIGGGAAIYQVWLMRTHAPVAAEVISTKIEHSYDDENEQPGATPRVRYEFTFNGRSYQGSNIYALPVTYVGNGGVSLPRAILKEYPPGEAIIVYVNPRDPTEAFIRPTFLPYIFPFFGGTMIFSGFVVALRSRSTGRSKYLSTAVLAITALLCGIGVTLHFYSISPKPYGSLPAISLLCYASIWFTVLAHGTGLTNDIGWQGAVRSGTLLTVIGLYLGLMFWVAVIVGSGWLHWVGLEVDASGSGVDFMLWTGGILGALGTVLGFFGLSRVSVSSAG